MDGFLSKPVPRATLRDLLERHGLELRAPPPAAVDPADVHLPAVASGEPSDADVLAPSTLRSLLRSPGPSSHGAFDVFDRITRLFAEETARGLDELEAALRARDASAVSNVAHRLKGSSAALGARLLADALAKIERATKDEGLPGAPGDEPAGAVAPLRAELRRALAAIDRLRASSAEVPAGAAPDYDAP
jgi:HPt (histidine-containing phosphotransfer) domain-containing protein